jgi:hypothetical protein
MAYGVILSWGIWDFFSEGKVASTYTTKTWQVLYIWLLLYFNKHDSWNIRIWAGQLLQLSMWPIFKLDEEKSKHVGLAPTIFALFVEALVKGTAINA